MKTQSQSAHTLGNHDPLNDVFDRPVILTRVLHELEDTAQLQLDRINALAYTLTKELPEGSTAWHLADILSRLTEDAADTLHGRFDQALHDELGVPRAGGAK